MLLITIIGKLTGLIFVLGIACIIVKGIGTHPERFTLEEGEEIVKMAKGDFWDTSALLKTRQYPGEFAFTNKRLIYKGMSLILPGIEISIPYNEITEIKKSFVGLWFPVAFTIFTKENKSYKFAIMKRHIYIDLITSLAQGQNT